MFRLPGACAVACSSGLRTCTSVARGHTVAQTDSFTSGLHGAVFNGVRSNGNAGLLSRNPGAGTYAGGADPRREGIALGNN